MFCETFDAGIDGWSALGTVTFSPSGGDPGGYLAVSDGYILAASDLGDLSRA